MKLKKSNNAVTELVGTILLLGIAVAIFSALYYIVLNASAFSAEVPYPDVISTIEGSNIIFEHRGGDDLSSDTEIILDMGNGPENVTVGDCLIDENQDGKWNIGEKIAYPIVYSLDNSNADAMAIDTDGGRTVLRGSLDITPESDIGIELTVDNQNPEVGDIIHITIKVINYHGDMNTSSIKIKFLLPDTLKYLGHNPNYNYSNVTGIWFINESIGIRDSISLVIQAQVLEPEITYEPTQMAMILDGSGSISSNDWDTMREGLAKSIENSDIFPHSGDVELTVVQFGGNIWNHNWDDISSDWYQTRYNIHSGLRCARSANGNEGPFTSDPIDTSGSSTILVDFWYRLDDTETDDLKLYYYNGNSYNYITSLGGGSEDRWRHYTETITDPQYFTDDFRIRFDSNLNHYENVWIDDLLIKVDLINVIEDGFEVIGYSRVEIPPTAITNNSGDSGYYSTIANQIRSIQQIGSSTPMSVGLRLAADQLYDIGAFDEDSRQIINLVTDGMSNCVWIPDTYMSVWDEDFAPGQASAEEARDYLIDKLEMTDDQDELDSLAVGVGGAYGAPDTDWLSNFIVWPQPGEIFGPGDEISGSGWVTTIEKWQDFEAAMTDMFTIQFSSIKASVEKLNQDTVDPNPDNNLFTITINPTD